MHCESTVCLSVCPALQKIYLWITCLSNYSRWCMLSISVQLHGPLSHHRNTVTCWLSWSEMSQCFVTMHSRNWKGCKTHCCTFSDTVSQALLRRASCVTTSGLMCLVFFLWLQLAPVHWVSTKFLKQPSWSQTQQIRKATLEQTTNQNKNKYKTAFWSGKSGIFFFSLTEKECHCAICVSALLHM